MKRKKSVSHDELVRKVAAGYKAQGYRVMADVAGYVPPPNTWRHRTDILAFNSRDKVFVEVETPRSLITDVHQRQIMRKFARASGARFRTVLTRR